MWQENISQAISRASECQEKYSELLSEYDILYTSLNVTLSSLEEDIKACQRKGT